MQRTSSVPSQPPAEQTTQLQVVRFGFDRGIDQSLEPSVQVPGGAAGLVNWVPERDGGLRVRFAWKASPDVRKIQSMDAWAYPTIKKVRGMRHASFSDAGTNRFWMIGVRNDDALEPRRAQVWGITDDFSDNWFHVYSDTAVSGSEIDSNPFSFAMGLNSADDPKLLFTHPRMTTIQKWAGDIDNPTVDAACAIGGFRALTYHKDRFWAGGLMPSKRFRLHFSALGKTDTWSVNDFIDVGRDDQEAIEDLAPFETLLYIGKGSGVWYLSGSGTSNFVLNRLDAGNCAPGRTLVPTPAGLVILGVGEAWIYAGSQPQLISDPVRDLYGAAGANWRTGAYVDGRVYVSFGIDSLPMLVWDIQKNAWSQEDVGTDNETPSTVASFLTTLAGGVRNSSIQGPIKKRLQPGGDRLHDDGAIVTPFHFETIEWSPTNISPDSQSVGHLQDSFTLRRVRVRCLQRHAAPGAPHNLTVIPYVDGVAQAAMVITPGASGDIIDIESEYGAEGRRIKLVGDQSPDNTDALFDVQALEVELLPRPVGRP